MRRKQCILVLGMHRSGTSALTGVIKILGADLGRNMMNAADDNEKGFFENNTIYNINERILRRLGSTWDNPCPLPAAWWREKAIENERADLKKAITDEFRGELIAVKDPRLCRLLPLWKELLAELEIDAGAVIPVRNPVEVAASIQKRNGISVEKAGLLWAVHVLEAELYSRDMKRFFLSFEGLLKNAEPTIGRMTETLAVDFPHRLTEAASAVNDFLQPGLKHANFAPDEVKRAPYRIVAGLYETLMGFTTKTRIESGDLRKIDGDRAAFMEMYDLFYNSDLAQQLLGNERARTELEDGLNESRRVIRKKDAAMVTQAAAIANKDLALTRQNAVIAEKVQIAANQAALIAKKDEALARLSAVIAQNDQAFARMETMLSEKDKRIADLLTSTSWRVTAPLRAASRALSSAKRYMKKAVRLLMGVYRRVPLSASAKRSIKRLFFLMTGPIFKKTEIYKIYLQERGNLRYGMQPILMPELCLDEKAIWKSVRDGVPCFAGVKHPRVSIIIPVYNQMAYTFNCLKSVAAHTRRDDIEIIVVDDCSRDRTRELLSRIKGLRVFRNTTNKGFIDSCNLGARQANGDFLVFLNNDTMVTPEWLEWLSNSFALIPDAGLVGAKIIQPNGRLQEAGGVIRKDGSAAHFGRDGDPADLRYNYLREVDFSSGACLMIPRRLFLDLGLFDRRYLPAYYEDVDLAFKVRAAGKKVLYQPHATLIHYEGTTAGTDTSIGVKRYQTINRQKFHERWREVLAARSDGRLGPASEHERTVEKTILVVDVTVCLPDQDAGSLRMYHMLRIFQDLGYKVSFFPDNQWYPQPYVRDHQGRGIEILANTGPDSLARHLERTGDAYDIVMISRLDVAEKHIDTVLRLAPRARVIFDTVDLHFLREGREAEVKNDDSLRRSAAKTKARELDVAARSHLTVVVSDQEKTILEKESPGLRIGVIPTINTIFGSGKKFSERRGMLFIGGFRFAPNIDAMLHFVKEILPRVRRRLPGIMTYLIGSNPPPEIAELAGPDVRVTGHVPDVKPYFDACRLSIAPLRFGAGVKGKVNTSMSYGLPVVATPLAVEGMSLRDGHDVLTASEPEAFADAVVRLYNDESLWNRLSANGLENVKTYFSIDAARDAVKSILDGDFHSPQGKIVPPSDQAGAVSREDAASAVKTIGDDDHKTGATIAILNGQTAGAGRADREESAARLIAFFLPQFHPIPENDRWWGDGFTEWRNVAKARPLFPGHHQPRLPTDLGYYDLRVPEVREAQAALARRYGIEGFCYWHYWFNGKVLLERPVLDVIASGRPDFPFCLAWANEPWSRRWSGEPLQVLQDQTYGDAEDWNRHFDWLLPALKDPRAVKIDGKPVFLIYKPNHVPNVAGLIATWRSLAREHGLAGLYLIAVETAVGTFDVDPRPWGFDASVEFQPSWQKCNLYMKNHRTFFQKLMKRKRYGKLWVMEYDKLWPHLMPTANKNFPFYPGVFPRWDNSPRRGKKGLIIQNSTPELYGRWLHETIQTIIRRPREHRIVFINAWNEWAEGNYLEPDQEFGHAYLEATYHANLIRSHC